MFKLKNGLQFNLHYFLLQKACQFFQSKNFDIDSRIVFLKDF